MSRRSLRIFMCAAAAAALGMFGSATQATFYGGDFDPPPGHFTGHFLLNVSDSCNSESCRIDVVSMLIDSSSTFGPGWVSDGQTDIATNAIFDGHLIAFNSVPVDLFIPSFASAIPCTPSVSFTETFGTDSLGHTGFIANLQCVSDPLVVGDNAIYLLRRIPEPGTLALILGGVGAGWLTRRRKAAS